jgi:hypothetical protein
MEDIYWMAIILVCGLLGLGIGLWRDPIFKCKMMRNFLKKNYIVLGSVSPDNRTIRFMVVNADNDRIKIGKSLWIVEGGRVYRQDKPQTGFGIGQQQIKWQEGVPTVYMYSDSLKPANFDLDNKTIITPEEGGAILGGFVTNELLKGFLAQQEFKTFLMVAIIVSVLGLLVAGGVYMEASAIHKDVLIGNHLQQLSNDHFGIIEPSNATNSTNSNDGVIVVKG